MLWKQSAPWTPRTSRVISTDVVLKYKPVVVGVGTVYGPVRHTHDTVRKTKQGLYILLHNTVSTVTFLFITLNDFD